MKKLLSTSLVLVIVIILGGCGNDSLHPSETVELGNSKVNEISNTMNAENAVEDNKVQNEEQSSLNEYSSEQIEYARVWLQLGPNQEIDARDGASLLYCELSDVYSIPLYPFFSAFPSKYRNANAGIRRRFFPPGVL